MAKKIRKIRRKKILKKVKSLPKQHKIFNQGDLVKNIALFLGLKDKANLQKCNKFLYSQSICSKDSVIVYNELEKLLLNDLFIDNEILSLSLAATKLEERTGYRKVNYGLVQYFQTDFSNLNYDCIIEGISEYYNHKVKGFTDLKFSDAVNFNDFINISLKLNNDKFIYSFNDFTLQVVLDNGVEEQKIISFLKNVKYMSQMANCEKIIKDYLLPNKIRIHFVSLTLVNNVDVRIFNLYFKLFPNIINSLHVYRTSATVQEIIELINRNRLSIREQYIPEKFKNIFRNKNNLL
jgi:hypothetical protein